MSGQSVADYYMNLGFIGLFTVVFFFLLIAWVRAQIKKQGHDGVLSDQTAEHYQKVIAVLNNTITTLQSSVKFEQQRAEDIMSAYKKFVEENILARLRQAEAQHAECDRRLTEAHRRLDDFHKEFQGFRQGLASAAFSTAPHPPEHPKDNPLTGQ